MKNKMVKVLFVCTYNGARSRIAEQFAKFIAAGNIEAHSACFETGRIGPLPINAMREIGIDISAQAPKSVFKRYEHRELYDYVISICNEATTEQCPVFESNIDILYAKNAERISWSIPDFKSIKGSEEEKKAEARVVRDKIKSEVASFLTRVGCIAEIDQENTGG